MTSTRNLVTTEYRGQIYGSEFDDSSSISNLNDVAISRIIVGHSNYIHSLTVHYTDNRPAVKHGGDAGTHDEVLLQNGEFITVVEGCTNSSTLSQLKFITNDGRIIGPFGSRGKESFVWKASHNVAAELAPRMGLLYFSGNVSETFVYRLRATFATHLVPARHPKVVKYEKLPRTKRASTALSNFAKNLMSPVITLLVGPDNVEFHAYQKILCRLPFFRAALEGEFREASTKKITMPEDEPEIVSALIEFLYTGSYTYPYDPEATTTSDSTDDTPACDLTEGAFHVGVYAVAFKYDCQELVEAAVSAFTYILKALNGIDVVRLWKVAYAKGLLLSEWENDRDLIGFKHGLAKLLKVVYETDREEMETMISEYPALASDLLRLLVSSGCVV